MAGMLEALTSIIGEADSDLGGMFSTRLSAAMPAGSTTILVESTLGWDDTGRLGIDGIVYYYTSKTDTSFSGIYYLRNNAVRVGTKQLHRVELEVLDLNRSRSAIDLVRRSLLIDYAEGDYLSALGRNLGVLRLPFVGDDARFRKVLSALAYNPRGTMYGLELALDGLVDAGNYEIFEDLINYPCTVFIRLAGAATTEAKSAGKIFLAGGESRPLLTSSTLATTRTPTHIRSVFWKDEDFNTDIRNQKPSALMLTEYTGATPHPAWDFHGLDETDVSLVSGSYCDFFNPDLLDALAYERSLRIQPNAQGEMAVLFAVPTIATLDTGASTGKQFMFGLSTTAKLLAVGTIGIGGAGPYNIGFITQAGAFIAGAATLVRDQFYDVRIKFNGMQAQLFIDGQLVQTLAYTALSGVSTYAALYGLYSPSNALMRVRIKQVDLYVHTPIDYWASWGAAGSVLTANPDVLNGNISGHFLTTDLNKVLLTYNSAITNSYGGNNNGKWYVDSLISSALVTLKGDDGAAATVATANPKRIVLADGLETFTYPDDLGKRVVLSGSSLSNNGTYVIQKLLDPDTLVDLATWGTPIKVKTHVCEVVAASFVSETGLDWRILPNFENETGLAWVLSDAGVQTGMNLSLKQAMPSIPLAHQVVDVWYADVLSAQILENEGVSNYVVSETPLRYLYYPCYLSDPLGYVRDYGKTITAAGVIPDFLTV